MVMAMVMMMDVMRAIMLFTVIITYMIYIYIYMSMLVAICGYDGFDEDYADDDHELLMGEWVLLCVGLGTLMPLLAGAWESLQ